MSSGPLAAGTGLTPLWYTTRATGVVALALLTATVVLGVAGVNRFATPRWPRLVTSGLHRNLSLMAVGFLLAHILTALLDAYAPVGWASVVLPFSSAYRPFWLGLGTLAFDLLLAVVTTSLLRARLHYRSWRAVHWAAYAAWPIALWHGLGTGTDGRLPWLLVIDAVCVLSVLAALWWRLSLAGPDGRRGTVATASVVFSLATVVFVAVGPMRPGWARRAGTPAALLSHRGSTAVVAGTSPGSSPGPAAVAPAAGSGVSGGGNSDDGAQAGAGGADARPANAPFAGSITQSQTGQNATVSVTADTTGQPREHIVITLHGSPGQGGGVALSSGRVSLTVAAEQGHPAAVYQGPVTSLSGDLLRAVLAGPRGERVPIRVLLSIGGASVTGRLGVTSGGDS